MREKWTELVEFCGDCVSQACDNDSLEGAIVDVRQKKKEQ